LFACRAAIGNEPSVTQDRGRAEEVLGELLVDTPYINSLLINREFPVIGGRWGWQIFVDAPLNGEPDGAQITLRHAKIKYARNFGNNWQLKLSGNYTRNGGLELSDDYVSYSGWKRTLLTLGISDPAYSLEKVTKSSALTFMERGLPVAALSERKSAGVNFLRRNPKSIFSASLIMANVNQDNISGEGRGFVLHYVHSPIEKGEGSSIHLGGSFSYRFNAGESGGQFRSRPEVATVNDYFVDTGFVTDIERVGRFALEASQVIGRFSWQSELLTARVYRYGKDKVDFWGAYAFASWFLTEDSRNYHFGSGSFGQVLVRSPFLKGGPGAVELAFRASVVDLTDEDIIGGREKNLSIGLNWYLNQRIRLMANLVKVLDLDRPGSEYDGQEPLIFSMRIQWVLD
jgi:phosphate-selective porin OprO/OprP